MSARISHDTREAWDSVEVSATLSGQGWRVAFDRREVLRAWLSKWGRDFPVALKWESRARRGGLAPLRVRCSSGYK